MPVIREAEGRAEFERSISVTPEHVARAKHFLVPRVDKEAIDGAALIRGWWVQQKAPPLEHLVLHDDYDYPSQCQRAARHWEARLCAAQALRELVADGYLEAVDNRQSTEQVNQGFTTVVERSGGTTGGWSLESLQVPFPARVRKGVFAKAWDLPSPAPEASGPTAGAATEIAGSLTAIADPDTLADVIEHLNRLERQLDALAESNVLGEHGQEILVDEALPLLRELREVLTRVAANELDRLNLVKQSLVQAGKVAQALSTVGRFSAGLAGLGKVPDVIRGGVGLVQTVVDAIG